MMDKQAYLVILKDGSMKVINKIEEFSQLEFASTEDAVSAKIFEIEFKKKMNFNTKVKIEVNPN